MSSSEEQPMTPKRLRSYPASVRVFLTAFIAIIGVGYLVAIANLYERHNLADGKPGMSKDDIRAIYSGLTLNVTEETVIPSQMLTQIRTAMRQYLEDDAQFNTLESWLVKGGPEEGLDAEHESGKTPRRVLIKQCMRCHAESTGSEISKVAPFGPDEFSPQYGDLKTYLATDTKSEQGVREIPPQYDLPRLILISHIHMLSIPVFTFLVGLLFTGVRGPGICRAILLPIPMISVLIDFGGWWLARSSEAGVLMVLAGGAAFGIAFGAQLLWIALDLWLPSRPTSRSIE